MQSWLSVCLLVCTFGLIRELRPSEPFVSEFLLGEWRNITETQLNRDVYPVGTYSYLALLVFVFLVTDYLRYKPLIVLSGISGIIVYSILLWTESLEWLQVSQFFYGLYMATEVAYYTYMFAKIEQDKYERVASYSRSAALIGRFLSGTSAQILVSFKFMNLRQLNYITFSTQIFATFWALLLPSVDRSIYFHRDANQPIIDGTTNPGIIQPQATGILLLWEHIKSAYSKGAVVTWSVWYAASTAGFYQVQYYMQLLWKEISQGQTGQTSEENLYNGVVEAVLTILGAIGALLGGIKLCGNKNAYKLLPAIAAALQAGAVLAASFAVEVWVSYVGYIVLGAIYHYMITIASFEIAHNLVYDSCFGLIFGINTLVALAIQSLITLIIISENGLGLNIREQYIGYSIYYVIISAMAVITWIIHNVRYKLQKRSFNEQCST